MNKCAFGASFWLILMLFFVAPIEAKQWRAVHLLDYNTDNELDALGQNLETLAKQGINVIVLEVDYNFAGFRVLPAGWKNVDATKALIRFSKGQNDPKMLGYMFTTWGVKKDAPLEFPPIVEGMKVLRGQD